MAFLRLPNMKATTQPQLPSALKHPPQKHKAKYHLRFAGNAAIERMKVKEKQNKDKLSMPTIINMKQTEQNTLLSRHGSQHRRHTSVSVVTPHATGFKLATPAKDQLQSHRG